MVIFFKILKLLIEGFKLYFSASSFISIVFFVSFLLSANLAQARFNGIGGSVSLGYDTYDLDHTVDSGGAAKSFYQKYHLETGLSGNLYNEKSGLYNLYLTYDFDDYDNKINGEKYSLSETYLDLYGTFFLRMPHLNGMKVKFFSFSNEYPALKQHNFAGELGAPDGSKKGLVTMASMGGEPSGQKSAICSKAGIRPGPVKMACIRVAFLPF